MLANRSLIGVALGLGFLSTTTQVIILRELLVAFTGNELTLATTLAVWLLSIAAGCLIFKRLTVTVRPVAVGLMFIIAASVVLFQAISVRLLDPVVSPVGEMMSPLLVISLSVVCIVPGALLLGALFVALVALAGEGRKTSAVPLVYGCEAIGSAAAGALMSVLLVRFANSFVGLTVAGLVSLACGNRLLVGARPATVTGARILAGITLGGLLAALIFSSGLDLSTRRIQWAPLKVIRSVETRYGNIVVTDRGGTFDFFTTGNLSHTVPDPLYAEESAHIPMLYHPAPRRVLVIGGVGSGIIGEVTKHPTIEAVDFVELDPTVIGLTEDYAPRGWLEGGGKAAVTPIYGDGRKYVAATDRRYDVLILSVGLPVTLQTSRYYTAEFLGQAERILEREGIIALKVPSGGAYVSPEMGLLLSSLRSTCRRVFDSVIMVPGPYIHILASPSLPLADLTESLPVVLRDRAIATSFVDEYHLFDRLAPLRRSQLDSVTAKYRTGVFNSDTRPISASYAIARWARHFESGELLAALVRRMTAGRFLAALVVSAVVAVFLLMRATGLPRSALPGSMVLFSVGLTSMFTQILIIVAFQIVNGYLYGWIAALIGSFMLGMGLASSSAASRGFVGRPGHLPLAAAGLMLLPLAALPALRFAGADSPLHPLPVSDIVFAGLAFGAGLLGGSVFAVGSTLLTGLGPDAAAGGALAYSLDLCGATVAGFSTAFLAIPSLGVATSAYAVAVFNAILLIAILIGRMTRGSVP